MPPGSKYDSDITVGPGQSGGYTGNSAQASGIVPANDPGALSIFGPQSGWAAEDQQLQANNQNLSPTQMAAQQEAIDNADNAVDNPDTTLDKVMQDIALYGDIAGVGLAGGAILAPAIAAGVGGAGAAAGGAGVAGSVGTGIGAIAGDAGAGALTGAVGSGLEGKNIGEGALIGAVGGGLGAAAQPLVTDLTGAGVNPTVASGLVKGGVGAGVGALGGAITGQGAGNGALVGGLSGAANGVTSNLTGSTALGGVAGTIAGLGAQTLTSPVSVPTLSPSTATSLAALPTDPNAGTTNIGSYSGYGYQPRQEVQNPVANYATYGQGPEASFFQNVGAPVPPSTSAPTSNTQPVGQPPAVSNTQPVPISIPTLRQ